MLQVVPKNISHFHRNDSCTMPKKKSRKRRVKFLKKKANSKPKFATMKPWKGGFKLVRMEEKIYRLEWLFVCSAITLPDSLSNPLYVRWYVMQQSSLIFQSFPICVCFFPMTLFSFLEFENFSCLIQYQF